MYLGKYNTYLYMYKITISEKHSRISKKTNKAMWEFGSSKEMKKMM